jgi:hypothetical protein
MAGRHLDGRPRHRLHISASQNVLANGFVLSNRFREHYPRMSVRPRVRDSPPSCADLMQSTPGSTFELRSTWLRMASTNSGIGLTTEHGILLVGLPEERSTQVSWSPAVSSTMSSKP